MVSFRGSTKLPFLDIQIEIIDTKFIFTVYRKKTFTGLLLNFHAKCPLKWKIGLVNGMLHRAYSICSSWKLIHLEFEKIFDILRKNNYSREFLENILKSFLCKKFNPFCNPDSKVDKYIFVVPFIEKASMNFRRKLQKLFKSVNVEVQTVFTSTKVKSYFSLKCKTHRNLKTNVIYRYNCSDDPSVFYIGKTKRFFGLRMSEHLEKDKRSAVHQHVSNCRTCKTSDLLSNFHIIDTANNDYELKILEALHISRSQPLLNKQLFESGSNFILNVF